MIARRIVIAAAVLWSSFALSPAQAGLVQQGPKLVGTGAAYGIGAGQGSSVAISADGNTAIVGASLDSSSVGAAWVYTRISGAWSQQGTKLVGAGAVGASRQGVSVALSADGNTAIVGGSADNGNVGAAWVFTCAGGTWTQQGSKLVGTGAVGISQQGTSVALSADGNTAIVGGTADNLNAGAAWVFTRAGVLWVQQGPKLVGSGASGAARQGRSVALSADGNTAIVGGTFDNAGTGAAWVFTRGASWVQQGSKLLGTGAVGAAHQGQSVALSSDGNTAVVGGPDDNASVGAAWVYARSGGVWSQQGAKLVNSSSTGTAQHGWSVSVSGDGSTAIVGGPAAGAAWTYTRNGGVWSQFGDMLIGSGGVGVTGQGSSVAISADGSTAVVGGPGDNNSMGAAWVFVFRGEPVIASAVDVPGDQGGWLRLTLDPSSADDFGALNPVSTYVVWRFVPETLRFACSVVGFSSQRSTTLWSAGHVLGPPDVYPDYVDSPNAWASLTADGQAEHLDVQFSDPAAVSFVSVYETFNPGAIDAIFVMNPGTGLFEEVWSGTPAAAPEESRIFSVTFPQTAYPVSVVRIQLDSPAVPGWNEIDAVGIGSGTPPTALRAIGDGHAFSASVPEGLRAHEERGRVLAIGGGRGATASAASPTLPCGTWELVASMPAMQLSRYVIAVPTISNAEPSQFVVTAGTSTPSIWYVSTPASGRSVDNLAPATPAPFTAAYAGGATHLHWGGNSESDLGSYHLYRGGSSGFVPAPGNLVAAPSDTGYVDPGPAGAYYKLSALDVNGNESGYALITPGMTLSVGDGATLALTLEGVRPNPSRGQRLDVLFTLPIAAPARLELLDVGGRLVAAREVGTLGPGRHSVDPAVGRRLRPGLYLVRLTQGGASRAIRVAVVE